MIPRIVAIIGASSDRTKFGNKALRAYRDRGDTVIPINPRETEVEGIRAFRSVLEVPGPIDMATLYVPPRVALAVLDEVAAKGIRDVWLNPGTDSPEVVARARALGLQAVMACSISAIGGDASRL